MEQKVKFGFAQITNQTPQFAKWGFRVILYLAAIANLILTVITEIPPDIKAIVAKYSIYAVTIVHSLSKMFGIEVEDIS